MLRNGVTLWCYVTCLYPPLESSGQPQSANSMYLQMEVGRGGGRCEWMIHTHTNYILGKRNVFYIVQRQNEPTMNILVFTCWERNGACETDCCLSCKKQHSVCTHTVSLPVCKNHTIHHTTFVLALSRIRIYRTNAEWTFIRKFGVFAEWVH